MRALVQRVLYARLSINGLVFSSIGPGMLLFLGVHKEDTTLDIEYLIAKLCRLRIFDDTNGVMNFSLLDTGGEAMVVSQFTLFANCKKGNRPSWMGAAAPDVAEPLYLHFLDEMGSFLGRPVESGKFGASMQIELLNDGPVTLSLDSQNRV